jgi:2,4-dienoyl-CoA reductase-like NADH-dependent reductase (Old Yellow Enzyme family)/thioredoxin reductase
MENRLKYPHLFRPIRLGGALFRNRIFASPTGFIDMELYGEGRNLLPPEAAYYYERKAAGGAAAVTVGEMMVDSEIGSFSYLRSFADNPHARFSYARIASAIKRQGAIASAELDHSGMFANRYPGASGAAYGPIETERDGRRIFAMPEEMIERTIIKFAEAAAFAKRCGFEMVTIHGGHGWLIQQFFSPKLNTRKDKWGGAEVENRARFAVSICDAVRKAVGPGFPIEIRISGSECYDGGYDIEDGVAFAKQLDEHVDLIHVSAGNHEVDEVYTVTHPSLFLPDGVNVRYAAEIKKHVKTPVATVGALADPDLMESIIAEGRADIVEAARGLLADPDLPTKARVGKKEEIRRCMRCLSCFSALVNTGQFYCAINPESGREAEMKFDIPPTQVKKVLVVGGGVAGMQAALTCAKRGHAVILCEKDGRLGGVLRCEERVPFKQLLVNYLDYQARQIAKAGVDVRLNTEVTPKYARDTDADAIIAALGARPLIPRIPGIDGPNVLSVETAYANPTETGPRVAILGAGLVGIELAIHLGMLGKTVTVIEMLDAVNDGGNNMHAKSLPVQIKKYGITLLLSAKAEKIDKDGVRCHMLAEGDREYSVPADSVIYAVGQRPRSEEAVALHDCAPLFWQIGDCVTPKNIMAATSVAHEIARNIGKRNY